MNAHSNEIPSADSTWAVDPLEGDPEGNGTGPTTFEPAPTVTVDPSGTLSRQPGTWPTSAFDLDLPPTGPDGPLPVFPTAPAPLSPDVSPAPDGAAQPDGGGSAGQSPAGVAVPAFKLALKIDDADTGVSRVELTATGSAAWVNSIVETAMFSFMEEVNRQ